MFHLTELAYCQVHDTTPELMSQAVESARKAMRTSWGIHSTATQRRKALLAVADALEREQEQMAQLECMSGKPIKEAKDDVQHCIEVFRYFAGYADKLYGRMMRIPEDRMKTWTVVEPVGLCALVTSYNYPLSLVTWKLAPALACGNAVLVKPHQNTPLSALFLAQLFHQHAKLPEGALSFLPGGADVGQFLGEHVHIDKLSFTGSGGVGRQVMTASAKSNFKRITLELGGKSPLIVFPDADMEKCVEDVCGAIFTNMGQNCCAGSKLYLHRDIHDSFVERLKQRVEKIRIGNPSALNTEFGPIVDAVQFEKIMGFIQRAMQSEAKVLTGGKRHGTQGYFVQPTVFYDIDEQHELSCEEVFGPVLSIMKPFDKEDEVIQRANAGEFGLAAGLWTKDLYTAERVVTQLRAGTTWINCYNGIHPAVPFGGLKQSGFGVDLGPEAVTQEYTVSRAVYQYI